MVKLVYRHFLQTNFHRNCIVCQKKLLMSAKLRSLTSHTLLPFHCMKRVRNWSVSGQYFPAFGLHTERYSVSFRIQSECVKIQTRKTPNMDTFHAVLISGGIFASCSKFIEYCFILEAFLR